MTNQIFKGLKVVEFASVLAGPAVGMFLAELGATVVKIENKTTGGDVTRSWKLPSEDPESPISAYFCSVNWGKKHVFLDLTEPEDLKTAMGFALEADVLISNFKPAFSEKYGLDAPVLHQKNPGLIYAQLYAFSDPHDERPAFDVVLQAEAGFMYMNGEPDRPPVKMPVALIDILAAHQLKEGILLALYQRSTSGCGALVETSLFESALASLANQAGNWLMAGHIPQRMGAQHPNIAPYGDMFVCADGKQILLATGTEKQFRVLCQILDLENLPEDKDYQNNTARVAHRHALNQRLQEKIGIWKQADLLEKLHQNAVPAAQIRNMQEVFELPAAQDMILREGETQRVKTRAFRIRTV
ncbi:MAG: CoA transferase [Bacteroidetes bacterium]|nr:CoA transferase [Bacteroidota bacterium]